MGKIRVYALAKELKVDNQRVIEMARELGAKVSRPSNALDDATAEQIRKMQESMTSPASPPVPPTVVEDAAPLLPQPDEGPETAAAPEPPPESAPERAPAKPAAPAPSAKRSYLIDGLNVCNWGKETTLAPLVTLLIELKRRGHPFICICDANTRFVLEERGERDKYEHLINNYDCIGEVPGGTQADDFLLFRAHKTGEAIITNDQYRDQRYRERYKWLRSVSPRLCKGIVLGGYLIIPELDIHVRVRDHLAAAIKEFDTLFGRPKYREHRAEPHEKQRPEQKRDQATEQKRQQAPERKHERKPEPRPAERRTEQAERRTEQAEQPAAEQAPAQAAAPTAAIEAGIEGAPEAAVEQAAAAAGQEGGAPRSRSRRRRRRGGKRPAQTGS